MLHTGFSLAFVLLFVTLGQCAMAAAPATRPSADPEYRVGEVDVQTVSAFTYASVHARTTLARLQETLGVLMPKIQGAVAQGAVHPSGAMVFTYNGATGEADQEFDLRIGFFVDRAVAAGSGIDSSDEPAMQCATLVYRGSVAHLKEAFGKLYGEIGARGLTPTAITREVYLYWEGPNSPNNIIQLQAQINARGSH